MSKKIDTAFFNEGTRNMHEKNEFIKTIMVLSFLITSLEIKSPISLAITDKREERTRVIVKKDLSKIVVRDMKLHTNDKWDKRDNFIEAFDRDGHKLNFEDLQVSSDIDTRIPGIYEVKFEYQDHIAFAIVTVEDSSQQKLENRQKLVQIRHQSVPVILNKDLFENDGDKMEPKTDDGKGQYCFELRAYYLSGTLLFGQRRVDKC